jgi:hypothetical protein
MAFPTIQPTSRAFNPGDYPIKTFKSQSGTETRILYGSQRTGMTMELNYENIADADAASFMTHYDEVRGSYQTFAVPSAVRAGWSGSSSSIDVTGSNAWRYDSPPSITAVCPGRSSVSVQLVGVL